MTIGPESVKVGLFDYLTDQKGCEWQTKDFDDPQLNRYRVTNSGSIERGIPLGLPRKYLDYPGVFSIFSKKSVNIDKDWIWNKVTFSGILRAIREGPNGSLQEAVFEFENGALLEVSSPQQIT